jgi:tetratricopeptide (TPR) repeat protein
VKSSMGALLVLAFVSMGCAMRSAHGSATESVNGAPLTTTEVRPGRDSTFATSIETQDPILSELILVLDPSLGSPPYRRVAERYYQLKILDTAFDYFMHARAVDPNDGAASEGLARVWRDWGFLERGLNEARRAVFEAPSLPAAHNTLGTILLTLRQYAEARQAFEQALALTPGAAYAFNNLCYLSLLSGDVSGAMGACRAALDADPGFIPARNNLALVFAFSQREDLALREFNATGDPAAAAFNIGLVRLAAGQYATATQAFDDASRRRPDWSMARLRANRTRALAAAITRAGR